MLKTVQDTKRPAGRPVAAVHRQVLFILTNHEAEEVYLCGDFNEWSSRSLPMIWHADYRWWEKRLMLPPGCYEYQFIVDGKWIHDPQACNNVPNANGSLNSVVEVKL
jgi:1,4-alpha-glucan branching enzyme